MQLMHTRSACKLYTADARGPCQRPCCILHISSHTLILTTCSALCREALKTYSARQLRLMFLLQPWHKPMSYGEQCV